MGNPWFHDPSCVHGASRPAGKAASAASLAETLRRRIQPTARPLTRRNLHVENLKEEPMGLGVSLFLIAVGAILTWAVNAEVSGVDIQTSA